MANGSVTRWLGCAISTVERKLRRIRTLWTEGIPV
jgi:hypothetical protein